MEIILLYFLAFLALLIGVAFVVMALSESISIRWVYYHYFIRKPVNWTIFIIVFGWVIWITNEANVFPIWSIGPMAITGLALVLTHKLHAESAFRAVDFPNIAVDVTSLPLDDQMQMAVIEYQSVTKCFPLDYVVHHHIINDQFGDKTVALTYCALCRSIIPFDVTDIGPLFVAAMKNGNMIVADRKTKTFFQQGTFQSVIGRLHPAELKMIPFQILSWSEVKRTIHDPKVVQVSPDDFRAFQLPIPGIWNRIMKTEFTPGLSSNNRDKSFPARTPVIGVIDETIADSIFYLKQEVLDNKLVINEEFGFFLVGRNDQVAAFRDSINGSQLVAEFENSEIIDMNTQTHWDIRGKYLNGPLKKDLEIVAISDEYWFAWKKFHQDSRLLRL